MAEIKHLVRIANTDLPGAKQVMFALTGIKGVSISLANAACASSGIDKKAKLGLLSEADVKKLNGFFENPSIPAWMKNRQKDYETRFA